MTDKQRRFVEEYCIDFNATQAAVRAGYSERNAASIGYQLLHKTPYGPVQEAIREHLDELAMSADEALARLTEQGRNVQMRYLQADGTVDLAGLIADGLAHLVKGTKFNTQGKLQVEFYDAQAAVREIARIRGLLGPDGSKENPKHVKLILERVVGPDTPSEVRRG